MLEDMQAVQTSNAISVSKAEPRWAPDSNTEAVRGQSHPVK